MSTNATNQNRILFVCLGNICRSPMAEGLLTNIIRQRRESDSFFVDSAGTHDYHVGKSPDPRAIHAALKRGIDISSLRGRQLSVSDFESFDLILVMDERNLHFATELCPVESRHKIKLVSSYVSDLNLSRIPDPYHEDDAAFDKTFRLLATVCDCVANALLRTENPRLVS